MSFITTDSEHNTTTSELIRGEIKRIVYRAMDSGYVVLKVIGPSICGEWTVTGYIPDCNPGQSIKAEGIWVETKHYGKQFKAEVIEIIEPKTKEGLFQYLSSGIIKGIGKQMAERIIDAFGLDCLDVIQYEPEKLAKISGIGKKRADSISDAFQNQKHMAELLMVLKKHGIGMQRAIKIYKVYGQKAITLIKENPYQLHQDIHGIGFLLADQIAKSQGMDDQHPTRLEKGLQFVLTEHTQSGHTCMLKEHFIEASCKLLDLPETAVLDFLPQSKASGFHVETEVDQQTYIYHPNILRVERNLALRLFELTQSPGHLPPESKLQAAIDGLDHFLGYQLSQFQSQSLRTLLTHKVCILTGGPGVGKTTLVQSLVRILSLSHRIVKLCAPTGRAAKRLYESTQIDAKTIHRLLGIDPVTKKFIHHADNRLKIEYLIIDECSMIDVFLMEKLLCAIPDRTCVIFVGDIDQLPSVGPGTILKDLIDSQRIKTVALTEIFRQGKNSCIIEFAHRVRIGKMPHFRTEKDKLYDSYGLFFEEPKIIIEKMTTLMLERIPKTFSLDPKSDIQILSPMHKGPLGTGALNEYFQKLLNPNANQPAQSIQTSRGIFAIGDKLMQTKNNYDKDVFNGDIGFVTEINHDQKTLHVSFDGKVCAFYFDELDELTLAYAMSIHKSQGSEFPAVIMPIHNTHYMMLERTLLYTGMTRAKKLLITIGQKKAFHMAINNHSSHERIGHLQHHIDELFT